MTTTTHLLARRKTQARGHTLVEVMVASALATILLAAIMTMFLFTGRSSVNVGNYSDMETEARVGLERFGRDARQANSLTWLNENSVRLTVNTEDITYAYDSGASTFNRTDAAGTKALITGIRKFKLIGNMITGEAVDLASMGAKQASSATKQIQIYVEATRSNPTVTTASNTVLSARFILRNKRVTA